MGARILRRRKEKGLTQEALANKLGVSNQAVSKWEGDVCCPDLQLLPLLADTLELSLDELFGRESMAKTAQKAEADTMRLSSMGLNSRKARNGRFSATRRLLRRERAWSAIFPKSIPPKPASAL